MPEGDVVWRTGRRLESALGGRRLMAADLRWPSLATADLSGRLVLGVASVGKHLLMRLEPDLTLHSHLRMDGSWHVHRTGVTWSPPHPAHGVRAVLANDTWTAVGHLLGMLDLVPTAGESTVVGHLGPDVLGPGWDTREATRRLLALPDRPVGETLLDQRVLAGLGTFYMCETLFLRGVTPWTPVTDCGAASAVVSLARELVMANRDRDVQVTTGDTRRGQERWVFGRVGRPCRRCGTTVRAGTVGEAPRERPAFFCPRCQHGPAPGGAPRR